ncbi:MAG: hypothetical protein K2K93_10100 [Muribaculaceae bacterium]|nr:hypothetical protein [Muribaculaceae bacterium]
MDIQEILKQLTAKFGDSFDITKVTNLLKTLDLKNLSFTDIVSKLGEQGLLKNVDLESVKGNVLDELKNKAGGILGGMFGK